MLWFWLTFRAALTVEGTVAVTLIAGPQVHTASMSGAGIRVTPFSLTAAQLMALILWKCLG